MSRSDSLVTPPVTKAWAMTTVRPPRRAASARTRVHGRPQDAGVGALGGAEGLGGEGRLEVGEGVHRDVAEHDRPADVGDGGAHVDAGALEEVAREPQAGGRVVVAAGEHDLGTGVDEPHQRLGEQRDGVGGRHRAVVDVAADEDGVDPLGAHDLDEVVEVGGLGVEQPHLVERAPQVPVGGVDQPHTRNGRRGGRHRP